MLPPSWHAPSIVACSLHRGLLPPSWRAPSIVACSLHHGVFPPSWRALSIMACSLHRGVFPPSWRALSIMACSLHHCVFRITVWKLLVSSSVYGSHTHASNHWKWDTHTETATLIKHVTLFQGSIHLYPYT